MFIQLTAVSNSRDMGEVTAGKVTIRKDAIAAICSAYAFNHDMPKNSCYRGNTHIHLVSGKVLPVNESLKAVEAMLLG